MHNGWKICIKCYFSIITVCSRDLVTLRSLSLQSMLTSLSSSATSILTISIGVNANTLQLQKLLLFITIFMLIWSKSSWGKSGHCMV